MLCAAPTKHLSRASRLVLRARVLHTAAVGGAGTPHPQQAATGAHPQQQQQPQQQQLDDSATHLAHQQPETQPPERVAWSAAAVNHVEVTGTLLNDPQLRYIAKLHNLPVGSCLLGLRPTYSRPGAQPSSSSMGSIALEGFGHQAYQMAQHLRKAHAVRVVGHLRQDRWRDASGEWRQRTKVVVDRLQMIDPAMPHREEEAAKHEAAAAGAAHAGALWEQRAPVHEAGPQAEVQAPTQPHVERRVRSSISAVESHRLFQSGMSAAAVAAERGIKLKTVLEHILTEAALGRPLDWQRMASELQIGPPGSPWLSLPELATAIQAVQAEMPDDVPLLQLPLSRIRQELKHSVISSAKLAALEARNPDRTLAYGAVRIGIAALGAGVDLLETVRHAPSPLQPVPQPPSF